MGPPRFSAARQRRPLRPVVRRHFTSGAGVRHVWLSPTLRTGRIRILKLADKTRFYQASTSEMFGLIAETPQIDEPIESRLMSFGRRPKARPRRRRGSSRRSAGPGTSCSSATTGRRRSTAGSAPARRTRRSRSRQESEAWSANRTATIGTRRRSDHAQGKGVSHAR